MMLRRGVLAACAVLALAAGCTKGDDETSVGRTDATERDQARMGDPVTGRRIVGRSGQMERSDAGLEVQLGEGAGGSGMAGTGCEEGAQAHGGGSLRSNAVHCDPQSASGDAKRR